MRENFKSGSVRGLIVTLEPILQQKVDYEPYSTSVKKQLNGHSATLSKI
jgi:redox-regulated HSP33 family molecular chaperone